MMHRYSLLVFDWDGTIIDSATTIAECIRLAAADLGLQVPTKEQASHVIGLGLHDALRHAVPGLPPERIPEFVERYREHFRVGEHTMDLFAGMRELLELLQREKILGIATGKSRRGLDRSLEATGLKPYFRASRCADETHPKPHPAMLRELMDELDVPARGVNVGRVAQPELEVDGRGHLDDLRHLVIAHEAAEVVGHLDVEVPDNFGGFVR